MIRVSSITLNPTAKTAKVSLEADTRAEVDTASTDDIVGFPEGYTIDFMSDVFTANKEMAFMGSDGQWNWGN